MSRTAASPVVSQRRRPAANPAARLKPPARSKHKASLSRRVSKLPVTKSAAARKAKHDKRPPINRDSQAKPAAKTHFAGATNRAAAEIRAPQASAPRLVEQLRGHLDQDVFSETPVPGEVRLVAGRSGDHASVYHMLLAVFQGPSRDEFHLQAEDPFYEPSDRLLVKRGFRVISHLHLTHRSMLFGGLTLPVTGFHWLGTLPEFRNQGLATRLLTEAQRRIAADGSVLGLLRTRAPRFFHRAGWAVCGRHSFSQSKAREVLAKLHAEYTAKLTKPLSIRLWRHVEMPALMRIYRQNTAAGYGPLDRTEAFWRWLVGRKAYDSLLVALDGPDKLELEENVAPIVGYAVLRQERVIELLSAPGHPTANYQLLARACGDAIEHDRQDLIFNAPPHHPLHRLICSVGGVHHNQESEQGEVFMVNIVDPPKFLSIIAPELESRAKLAGVPREAELGLQVDDAKWRLVYTRRGFRVRPGKLGRSHLTMNRAEFTRLALGHGRVRETAFAGRIQASTRAALDLAEVLFPSLPLWHPIWDDLPA
jgi:predicted acetyltransferase